jgi:hypothetical protein
VDSLILLLLPNVVISDQLGRDNKYKVLILVICSRYSKRFTFLPLFSFLLFGFNNRTNNTAMSTSQQQSEQEVEHIKGMLRAIPDFPQKVETAALLVNSCPLTVVARELSFKIFSQSSRIQRPSSC